MCRVANHTVADDGNLILLHYSYSCLLYTSPPATLSQEESEFINTYITDIQTMLQERMTKYILGTDTSSHDEFREKLKASQIEECTARWQAAVDRYNAR